MWEIVYSIGRRNKIGTSRPDADLSIIAQYILYNILTLDTP